MANYIKMSNKEILEQACANAEDIQGILNEMNAVYNVPEEMLEELSLRMFYQDYLYDCHGRKHLRKTNIRPWEDFKADLSEENLKKLDRWLNA